MKSEIKADVEALVTEEDIDSPNFHHYQKWDRINLDEFKSTTLWHQIYYAYLWLVCIVSIAAYAADTYTAVILVAFNRWPGSVSPTIPFNISRWIFFGCICFSFILLAFKWIRAYIVLKHNSPAKDYLDPLAAQYQSLRSWQRFLVFAELTESKKGTTYIALFTYFSFKGAVETFIARGPRQAINAMTLWAFFNQSLLPKGAHKDANIFFSNLKTLAAEQQEHAIIIFTMFFTLCVWIFSVSCVIIGALFYAFFLYEIVGWNLTRYCKRKIEKRLRRIVAQAMNNMMGQQDFDEMRKSRMLNKGKHKQRIRPEPTLTTLEQRLENWHWPGLGRTYSNDSWLSSNSTDTSTSSSSSSLSSDSSESEPDRYADHKPFFAKPANKTIPDKYADNKPFAQRSVQPPRYAQPQPLYQKLQHYQQQHQQQRRPTEYTTEGGFKIHPLPQSARMEKPGRGVPMGRYKAPSGTEPVRRVPGPMYGGWGENHRYAPERRREGTAAQGGYMDARAMEALGVR